ncbi:uncharacterized protein LOC126837164 [Adelges cooleyi]|uniref:uncharacterized protein LOC126837164 n=1 Tax=Adelges cooleyi TaxID=133065 RepID=UPI00217F982F|nr:uncharacterized protein LOC126837164 [Adelges cooleyi]
MPITWPIQVVLEIPKWCQINRYNLQNVLLNPKLRFKTAILSMIHNLDWLADETLSETPIDFMEIITERALDSSPVLTIFHKLTMVRPRELRTKFEIESIIRVLGAGFKFFKLCPLERNIAVMTTATYKCFGPDRIILKQDRQPWNMYYIVKGVVSLCKDVYDPILKKTESVEQCKLTDGETFGESAVMFNRPMKTSVKSLTTVELICISREDFVETLKDNMLLVWEKNAEAIKNSWFFNYLNLDQLNKASTVSFIKTYQPDEHVVGDEIGNVDYGHFMMGGKVNMIKRLKMIESPIRLTGQFTYRLYNGKRKLESRQKIIEEFLQICTFSGRSCFNIGESIKNKDFMVDKYSVATCLCVPKRFMYETERLKCWKRTQIELENIIPTTIQVFQSYMASKIIQTKKCLTSEEVSELLRSFND